MRVLTYNLHKGVSAWGNRWVLDRIKDAIGAAGADVVFLQEVVGEGALPDLPEPALEAQFEFLADQLWPHYAYGRNAVYSSGHHGNAILSKHPLRSWVNVDVSHSRFEPRGLLHGVLERPGAGPAVHGVCVHLGLNQTEREFQLRQLVAHLRTQVDPRAPLLVAGDFNDWRQRTTAELARELGLLEAFVERFGRHARSFPSWLPLLPLDRIYCRGLAVAGAGALFGRRLRPLSDHVALYADLDEAPRAPRRSAALCTR